MGHGLYNEHGLFLKVNGPNYKIDGSKFHITVVQIRADKVGTKLDTNYKLDTNSYVTEIYFDY